MKDRIVFEACIDSVEAAIAAQEGGADRVELCANLLEGGTTPSAGTIQLARKSIGIGLNVMIRPRGGDFCYSDVEFQVMKLDVELAKKLGADGIVMQDIGLHEVAREKVAGVVQVPCGLVLQLDEPALPERWDPEPGA